MAVTPCFFYITQNLTQLECTVECSRIGCRGFALRQVSTGGTDCHLALVDPMTFTEQQGTYFFVPESFLP